MRIYNRKLKIVKELMDQDHFVSSEYLSQRIGVSSRTIRDDIKQMIVELQDEDITKIKKKPAGIFLRKWGKRDLFPFYQNLAVCRRAIRDSENRKR